MKLLTVSLTILGLSASTLASQSKTVKQGGDGYPDTLPKKSRSDQWNNQKDTEMVHESGRGRRDGRGRSEVDIDDDDSQYTRRGHWEDRRDRRSRGGDRRGRGERRWNEDGNSGRDGNGRSGRDGIDRDGHGRDNNGRDGSGSNLPPYPPTNPIPLQPSHPDQPIERDSGVIYPVPVITTVLPPLPIIIEPIRSRSMPMPMPSIIEPYPEMVESETYHGSSSSVISPTTSYAPTSSIYAPVTSMHSSMPGSMSYAPSAPMSKKQVVYSAANSTTYGSTMIITEAEATVTAKVTGRYRAMSNAANNLAGSVSFTIVLISSIFLIALV